MISDASMPRPKRGNPKPVTPEDRKIVKELTGQILDAIKDQGLTRQTVARRAGRQSASTLYGWRNGDSERPMLLDLNDFARAVGLSVRLVSDKDGADTTGSLKNSSSPEIANLKTQTQKLIRIMERVPDDVRDAILEAATDLMAERLSDPGEVDEPQTGPLVHGK